MAVQFFYDNQIRRFLLQFIRIMSNFQVEFGTIDSTTNQRALQTVPVFYGDASRQASHMLRTSENSMASVPAMAVYITDLKFDMDRIQDPFFIDKIKVRTRRTDPDTGMLTSEQGDAYTVERQMPVPYRLTLNLDIWTSNTEQKLQIIEQIATLFNPSFEIQSTDNYIDWTSLSFIKLTGVRWDSRTVPIGQDDPLSIATMTFELPIWIASPAKLKVLGVIQNIFNNIHDGTGASENGDYTYMDAINDPSKAISRRALNVLGYSVVYTGNTLKLLKASTGDITVDTHDPDVLGFEIATSTPSEWPGLISQYGVLRSGTSEVRLQQENGNVIIGTIAVHPVDPTLLIFQPFVDTLPGNTIPPVTAIIDPLKVNVEQLLIDSSGNYLVTPGTRFLILNPIGSVNNTTWADAWSPNNTTLIANANDVIEYNGNNWFVSFDSVNTRTAQYVTNLKTGSQYHWDGNNWIRSYEGLYREGSWELII